MSSLYGTNVSATIKPFTTADNFPTHEAQYGKGGYRTVNSESDLTSISLERLEEGMLVYIKNNKKIYKYIGDTSTNNSNDWEEFTVASENEYYKVVDDEEERIGLQNILQGTLCYVLETDKLYKYTSSGWELVESEITPPIENEYYKVVASTDDMQALTNISVGTLCYVTNDDDIYKYTSNGWVLIESTPANEYYTVVNAVGDLANISNPTVGMLAYVKFNNEVYKRTTGNAWVKLVPEIPDVSGLLQVIIKFTNEQNITYDHNLNKFPQITITDTEGNVMVAKVQYTSSNSIKINLSERTSGFIYLN